MREEARTQLRKLWHPSVSQLSAAVVMMLLGLMVVTQIHTRTSHASYANARPEDLIQLADGLDAESRRLETELKSLEQTKRELESRQDTAQAARDTAHARLGELEIIAGTAAAQGPGVRITITDPRRKVSAAMLLDAIEEMRDAGAEAMEANDQVRIAGPSWVAGPPGATTIDGRQVSGTITLDVIGDPHALDEAARFRGGLVTDMTAPAVGASVRIERLDRVEVTSLRAPSSPQYARPTR